MRSLLAALLLLLRRGRPPSYYANEPETDASRCRLARDIAGGAARHRNGAPTDGNDRAIANRDIQSFCH